MKQEILNLQVAGPEYRGAAYPEFQECAINEGNIPDEMRFKEWDIEETEDGYKLTWMTYEDFEVVDREVFLYEVERCFKSIKKKYNYTDEINIAVYLESQYDDSRRSVSYLSV